MEKENISVERMKEVMQLYKELIYFPERKSTGELNNEYALRKTLYRIADKDMKIQLALAGHGLRTFNHDPDADVRAAVAKRIEYLSEEEQLELASDLNEDVRIAVLTEGYFLSTFIDDSSPKVRAALAYRKYGLETLCNDPDEFVRAAVVEAGYDASYFINDPSPLVRVVVARKGVGLGILYKDADAVVRAEVAKCGCYIDTLAHDSSEMVRAIAINSALYHEYTIKGGAQQ